MGIFYGVAQSPLLERLARKGVNFKRQDFSGIPRNTLRQVLAFIEDELKAQGADDDEPDDEAKKIYEAMGLDGGMRRKARAARPRATGRQDHDAAIYRPTYEPRSVRESRDTSVRPGAVEVNGDPYGTQPALAAAESRAEMRVGHLLVKPENAAIMRALGVIERTWRGPCPAD